MITWPALLTELARAVTRVLDFIMRREDRARETVPPPTRPKTVDEYLKRKRSPSADSASGSSGAK